MGNDWSGYASPQPNQGPSWIRIRGKERGQYPFIDVSYLPVTCMHCDDAPCIKAAKDGAITKRPDGIVIIDPVKAKGQKNVLNACPYGAILWDAQHEIPQKCTLCAHLLDEGWKKPRCVQSCPTGALDIHSIEDTETQGWIKAENLEAYQPEHRTSPSVYYRNLYRFTHCFIGGSIAVRLNGKEECVEGASVTLLNAAGDRIGECVTDNYGDFKFDNLEEDSGKYVLRISYKGHAAKTVDVDLKKSLNVGTIVLSGPS